MPSTPLMTLTILTSYNKYLGHMINNFNSANYKYYHKSYGMNSISFSLIFIILIIIKY